MNPYIQKLVVGFLILMVIGANLLGWLICIREPQGPKQYNSFDIYCRLMMTTYGIHRILFVLNIFNTQLAFKIFLVVFGISLPIALILFFIPSDFNKSMYDAPRKTKIKKKIVYELE